MICLFATVFKNRITLKVNLKYVWHMKSLFFILMLMLMLNSCTKENRYLRHYVPQALKDYMMFKPGTYWIYQDSLTGSIDCVYVKKDYDKFEEKTYDGETGNFEICGIECGVEPGGYTMNIQANTTWIHYNGCPVWTDKYKPGKFIGQTILMFTPFEIGRTLYSYSALGAEIKCENKGQSMLINGTNYSNTVVFSDSKNILYNYSRTKNFFSKNIGLIRTEIPDSGNVINLIDKFIIQ